MRCCAALRLTAAAPLVLTAAACTLVYGTPTPFPTPNAPLVEFLAPANNSQFVEGAEIIVEILAQDAGIGVARVEFQVDGITVSEALPVVSGAVPVFTVRANWLAEGVGLHALAAFAYRPDGLASEPAFVIVEVLPKD
ncbi:MAG: Ig-like domain-containing protein [Aggregatilineales bacterium]